MTKVLQRNGNIGSAVIVQGICWHSLIKSVFFIFHDFLQVQYMFIDLYIFIHVYFLSGQVEEDEHVSRDAPV